jgi:hypothetical protein
LFTPISRTFSAPQINIEKGALRDSYRNKLLEVGLIVSAFKNLFKATPLGKLLLRYIDEIAVAKDERSKET